MQARFRFNAQMTSEERQATLTAVYDIINEDNFDIYKHAILNAVLGYAKAKLVRDNGAEKTARYATCEAIFNSIHMKNTLYFTQFVVKQLEPIADFGSLLRDSVLPMALACRNALLTPHVRETDVAIFALALIPAVASGGYLSVGFTALAIDYLFSERLTRLRLNRTFSSLNPSESSNINGQGLNDLLATPRNALNSMINQGRTVFKAVWPNKKPEQPAPGSTPHIKNA